MDIHRRIKIFSTLGEEIRALLKNGTSSDVFFKETVEKATLENSWFTTQSIHFALLGIAYFLDPVRLNRWISRYKISNHFSEKKIAVIMAGNIPLIGFHDMLCVLMSGYSFIGKLSSKDTVLPKFIGSLLFEIAPELENRIQLVEERLPKDFDAVIATGSNNTARYFKTYFGKYPHIIRKNRTGIAVLNGSETKTDLHNLGNDVFQYFGLGCRNVSRIFLPENFDITKIISVWEDFSAIKNHYKYANNYDYNRIIFLMNKTPHLDTGFLLLKKDISLFSPISVLHYSYYKTEKELEQYFEKEKENIQCVAGRHPNFCTVDFGKTQMPELVDYADGVDTLSFLTEVGS